MKKFYPDILCTVDRDFTRALEKLRSDPLFSTDQTLYTDADKARIAHIW